MAGASLPDHRLAVTGWGSRGHHLPGTLPDMPQGEGVLCARQRAWRVCSPAGETLAELGLGGSAISEGPSLRGTALPVLELILQSGENVLLVRALFFFFFLKSVKETGVM